MQWGINLNHVFAFPFNQLTYILQIDVSFLRVCHVIIDHKFRHHIVKVAVDSRGDSRVDSQTSLTMLWRNSLATTGQTH